MARPCGYVDLLFMLKLYFLKILSISIVPNNFFMRSEGGEALLVDALVEDMGRQKAMLFALTELIYYPTPPLKRERTERRKGDFDATYERDRGGGMHVCWNTGDPICSA